MRFFLMVLQKKSLPANGNGIENNDKKGKKKKKNNKPAAMSLDEFNKMEEPAPKKTDSDGE